MIRNVVPCVCLGLLLITPLLTAPKKEFTAKSTGVVRAEFNIKVLDIEKSDTSGITFCKYLIAKTEQVVVGSCTTTEGIKLTVGSTYQITKANLKEGGTISINTANLITSEAKMKVVSVFTRARTNLAELENGSIVGNSDNLLNVGDYVEIN